MKKRIEEIYNYIKRIVLRIFSVLKNKWIKKFLSIIIVAFCIYLIYKNFNLIKVSFNKISINPIILVISSLLSIFSHFLSIQSWYYIISSLGYKFTRIELAHTQMISAIGKYLPGKLWAYSGKIFLSHSLGISGKDSSIAIVVEIIITYMLSLSLLLITIPSSVVVGIINIPVLLVRIVGSVFCSLIFITPLIIENRNGIKKYFSHPIHLYYAIFIRAGIWIISSFSFQILVRALGLPQIDIFTAITTVTGSFLIGFLVFLLPDGLFVRETVIVYLLRNKINTTDSALLSIFFRFQIISLEFLVILIIFIIWKIEQRKRT
jgi:glycosyltransferase 2 family protein